MTTPDPTRIAPNPSDSVLMTLARAAMAPDATFSESTWPRLDLNDPRQREFGDYELLEEIGRGGMGVVYRARQRSLDRDVAIKFIAAGIADSFNVARFLGEARAAARLLHPNIVPVHEVGSIDGVHYFSMPLVKGRTLADVLDAGTMKPDAAVALMLKLCDAIDYAHRLGLLHLDLKPANVLIDERGEPMITDFGLARHMDERGGVDAQEVSGTPSFMAPEQVLIKQYRLTPATDLYALGAILYRCLAGVSPHGEGMPDELMQRAASGRVVSLHKLNLAAPLDLVAVCMKCLELLARDRYVRVSELGDDLRRVRDGNPVSARPLNVLQRMRRWVDHNRWQSAAGTATVALALVTTVLMNAAMDARVSAEQARSVAEAERDRAQLSQELGASLFATAVKPSIAAAPSEAEMRRLSQALIAWVSARLPEDVDAQTRLTQDFLEQLKRHDVVYAERLVQATFETLGQPYRLQVIDKLIGSDHPHRHMLASVLTWRDESEATNPARLRVVVTQAMQAEPDDPATLRVLAQYCPPRVVKAPACLAPEAAKRLTEIAPENGIHWLLRVANAPEVESASLLHEAAKRELFQDDVMSLHIELRDAMIETGVLPPPIMAGASRLLGPQFEDIERVAGLEAVLLPTSAIRRVRDICNPSDPQVLPAQTRHDCLTIATRLLRSRGSAQSILVGIWTGYALARGTPLGEEMRRALFRHAFILESNLKLPSDARGPTDAEFLELGELEAFALNLGRHGLPSEPPPDWQPGNPAAMPPAMWEDSIRDRTDLTPSGTAMSR